MISLSSEDDSNELFINPKLKLFSDLVLADYGDIWSFLCSWEYLRFNSLSKYVWSNKMNFAFPWLSNMLNWNSRSHPSSCMTSVFYSSNIYLTIFYSILLSISCFERFSVSDSSTLLVSSSWVCIGIFLMSDMFWPSIFL